MLNGCSQLNIVDSERPSDMWAPLSTFCLFTLPQVIRSVDLDAFLQCTEFQMINHF